MKNMSPSAALAAAMIVMPAALVAPPASAQGCKFTADRSADVELAGVSKIVVAAGAGDLDVRGEEGRPRLSASGRACASSQELLDEIRIEARREGDTVYIKTVLPEMADGLFGWSRYAYLDLTVRAAKSAAYSIEDSSGDLRVSQVQSASVADSSGDQNIRDVAGDLQVSDSSGDIAIERVGALHLKDSSGDVEIDEVQGDVEVEVDSSGDLDIETVAGSVRIGNDSSGDIEIENVQRDVLIDSDSSGSIAVRQVGGDFTVGADSSGSIRHDGVLGAVRIPED